MPRFIGFALAVFIVVSLAMTASTAQSARTVSVQFPGSVMPENKVPGSIESTARRLMHQFKAQGFAVARGYLKLYTEADCDSSYAIMGTCYSNNPAAPYVIPVVPTWPDEWMDPVLAKGVFGPTHDGYSATFRLDPREALVILGRLPPPAKYFGLQTNVFTRQDSFDTESEAYKFLTDNKMYWLLGMFFAESPGEGNRIQLLSSLGNSINNVVIQDASGGSFDEARYFIITPDRFMEEAVRQAFSRVAVEAEDVFTEPIDRTLRVGLDEASDDFYTVIRYAMPLHGHEAAAAAWRQNLPLVVLRVRDLRTKRQPVPFDQVETDERRAAVPPETALAPELDKLVAAVCQRWNQPCSDQALVLNVQNPPLSMIGPQCIGIGMNCLADTQDTVYHFSSRLPFGGSRVYAMVGALSTRTENATYVGLGLNATLRQVGIDNVSDDLLEGSAADYASAVTDPDKFFVYYFARDCSILESWASRHCRSIPESALPDYDPTNPNSDQLGLSLRDYVFPGTARGADPALSLSPKVIALQAR
jgi:hypothetical protein